VVEVLGGIQNRKSGDSRAGIDPMVN
jgi:hypothetical protein